MKEFFSQYADNKLAIAIAAGVIGAILTKLVPFLYGSFRLFVFWVGRLIGGRFAYRDFCKRYLDWVVTENRELKLTGIVISDSAKKPNLEQVYVSLRVGQKENHNNIQEPWEELLKFKGEPYSWKELREIIDLTNHKEEKKKYLTNNGEVENEAKDSKKIALRYIRNAKFRNYLRMLNAITKKRFTYETVKKMDARNRVQWVHKNIHLFKDLLGDFYLRYILRGYNRIAILGIPGAGKTTLLQYIALTYSRERASDPKLHKGGLVKKRFGTKNWRLPIFIRLSSVAGLLTAFTEKDRDTSITDILHRILPPDLQSGNVASKFFIHYLKKGKCIILLDGLDEVPSNNEFHAVTRAINSLCLRYPNNQFVITSRVAGYRGGVNSDFKMFYVNDLTDTQINTFIDTWYDAVEKNTIIGRLKDEGHSERKARERRASKQSNDLKTTLANNIGIRRLATNPMLLSIIAVVHRSLATLPKERSKLYAQCSKILLEQWDISRGVRVDDTNLKFEQKEAIIRRIAVALHTGEIGTKGGSREADKKEVQCIIEQVLPNLGRPAQDASYLLQVLIERSGIIVERQREKLAFAHHTFQEYYSAQYLTLVEPDKSRDFLLRPENLLSDWWREVILLYAGHQADSSSFIKMIHQPAIDDLFRTRLRLGALCLNESIEIKDIELRRNIAADLLQVRSCSQYTTSESSLPPEINEYLIQLSKDEQWYYLAATTKIKQCNDPHQLKKFYEQLLLLIDDKQFPIRRASLKAIAHLNDHFYCDRLIDKAFSLLSEADESIQECASDLLVLIAKTKYTDKIITDLIKMVAHPDLTIALSCLNALETLKDLITPSIKNLLYIEEALRSNNQLTNEKGIRLFRWIMRSASEEQTGKLFNNIQDIKPYVYLCVTNTLNTLPPKIKEDISSRFLTFLDDPYVHIDQINEICLSNIENLDTEAVIKKLFSLLLIQVSKKDISNCHKIAALITRIDISFASSKICALINNSDKIIQLIGLKLLSELNNLKVSKSAVEGLFILLDDNDMHIRVAAIKALGKLNETEHKGLAVNKLLSRLNEINKNVKIAALQSLVFFTGYSYDKEIVTALNFAIHSKSFKVRKAAMSSLTAIVHKITDRALIEMLWNSLNRAIEQERSEFFFYRKKRYSNFNAFRNLLIYLGRHIYPEKTLNILLTIKNLPSFEEVINFQKSPSDQDNMLIEICRSISEHTIVHEIQAVLNNSYNESKLIGMYSLYILRDIINLSQFESSIIALLETKELYRSMTFNSTVKIAEILYTRTKSKKILDSLKKQLSDENPEIQEKTWHILQKIYQKEQIIVPVEG